MRYSPPPMKMKKNSRLSPFKKKDRSGSEESRSFVFLDIKSASPEEVFSVINSNKGCSSVGNNISSSKKGFCRNHFKLAKFA